MRADFWTAVSRWTLAACASGVLACGGDDAPAERSGPELDAGVPVASPTPSPDAGTQTPLYAVSTRIFGTDNNSDTSFVFVVPSLAAGAPGVDTKKVPEYPGVSLAYGPEKSGVVYLNSDTSGTMTELKLDEDGTQHKGRVVSFANFGINETAGGNVNVFLSPTKAYHVNQSDLSVVVGNPAEMAITGNFPLGLSVSAGYEYRAFSHVPLLVGDKLVLASSSWGDGTLANDQTVVVVDTTTDKVLSVTPEPRCSATHLWTRMPNGDVYFAPGSNVAAMHFVTPQLAPAPCALRMKAGETTFDPGFRRDLKDDVQSGLWGFFIGGASGEVLTRVASQTSPEALAAKEANDIDFAPVWEWWSGKPDAPPVRKLANQPAGTGYVQSFLVDGKATLVDYSQDTGKSTLLDATATDGPARGLEVPGWVYNVVRIR